MQHYIDVVQDRAGNVIGGAIVTVIDHSSGQSASLYSDANGSIPLTSVITDTNGTFSFYVASGRYNITVSKNGIVLSSVSDVFITVTADYPTAMSQADATEGISTVPQTISASVLQTQKPTAMNSATAQAGTSTTPQTVSASVLKAGAQANGVTSFSTYGDIPSNFVGVCRVGNIVYAGDGTTIIKSGTTNASEITTGTLDAARLPTLTKAMVGLSNVDNTSDLSKPASTATLAAQAAAEAARDAASVYGHIYANTTLGIAATSVGGYFLVPVAGGPDAIILYRVDAGPTATEICRFMSTLTYDPYAPTGYVWSIIDAAGRAAIGIKADGTFVTSEAIINTLTNTTITSQIINTANSSIISTDVYPVDALSFVIADNSGKVALGIKTNGAVIANEAQVSTFTATATASLANSIQSQQNYPTISFAIADNNGNSPLAIQSDGTVYIDTAYIKHLTCAGFYARAGGEYRYQLNFIINSGQSLGEGSTPYQGLTLTQEYDNLGFPAQSTSPTSFVPLTVGDTQVSGGRGESPMYGALGNIKELINRENGISYLTNDYQLAACNNAHSGYSITQLNKTTAPYIASISQIQSAYNIALAQGKTMGFTALLWTQGEADGTQSIETYKANLKQLINDYNTDAKAITNQLTDAIMICYQTTNYPLFSVSQAQLQASNETANIYMATPIYFMTFGDSLHIDKTSEKWLGGYYGLVYKRVVIDKKEWKPLQPIFHTINGKVISLFFNKSGLVWDTTIVPIQPNYGFDVVNGSGVSMNISNVNIINENTVAITMSSTPVSGWAIRYGATAAVSMSPFAGGAGNLRDSQGDTLTYQAINKPMHNWCVVFSYSI